MSTMTAISTIYYCNSFVNVSIIVNTLAIQAWVETEILVSHNLELHNRNFIDSGLKFSSRLKLSGKPVSNLHQ